ncbi:MAG: tetratricopeptide repeat protein, partial [Myxococcota bacterium]
PRPSSDSVRRQLFARRLAAATGRRSTVPPGPEGPSAGSDRPSVPPTVGAPAADRRALLRSLAQSIKQAEGATGGTGQVQRSLAEARRAEAEGDLVEAANALRLALALAPDDPEVQEEYDRVHQRLARGLAETYAKQARYEEETGKWHAAALSWTRVAEGRPGQAEPYRRAAQALLQAEGDLRQARDFAQKAVDLEPGDVRNRAVLGRVYMTAGMKANARRELEQAAVLDPGNQMVKNLLRELK